MFETCHYFIRVNKTQMDERSPLLVVQKEVGGLNSTNDLEAAYETSTSSTSSSCKKSNSIVHTVMLAVLCASLGLILALSYQSHNSYISVTQFESKIESKSSILEDVQQKG